MSTKLLLLAFICLAFTLDLARAKDREVLVSGAGTSTCAQFGTFYKENPLLAESMFFSWAQGYISAMNGSFAARKIGYHNLGAKSAEQQSAYLRTICDQHPLWEYWRAVTDLYQSLPFLPAPSVEK
jgi:hypothetical protein